MLKSISQLFKKKSNPEALSDYLRWRNGIFTVIGRFTEIKTRSEELTKAYRR